MNPIHATPAALILLCLAGCASTPHQTPKAIVETVPIATPCVPPNVPAEPTYVDSDDALKGVPDAAERYRLLIAGRAQRQSRLDTLEPVVAGCR